MFWAHQISPNNARTTPNPFLNNMLGKLESVELQSFEIFRKDRPWNPKDPLLKNLENLEYEINIFKNHEIETWYWRWDQYL